MNTFMLIFNWVKCLIFFSLVAIAFIVGNAGLGGTTIITFSTLCVSVAWYAIYCVLLGPLQQDNRSSWIQGYIIVVHAAWAFAGMLYYVDKEHLGVDCTSSVAECQQYWTPLAPYCIVAIAIMSIVLSIVITAFQDDE